MADYHLLRLTRHAGISIFATSLFLPPRARDADARADGRNAAPRLSYHAHTTMPFTPLRRHETLLLSVRHDAMACLAQIKTPWRIAGLMLIVSIRVRRKPRTARFSRQVPRAIAMNDGHLRARHRRRRRRGAPMRAAIFHALGIVTSNFDDTRRHAAAPRRVSHYRINLVFMRLGLADAAERAELRR